MSACCTREALGTCIGTLNLRPDAGAPLAASLNTIAACKHAHDGVRQPHQDVTRQCEAGSPTKPRLLAHNNDCAGQAGLRRGATQTLNPPCNKQVPLISNTAVQVDTICTRKSRCMKRAIAGERRAPPRSSGPWRIPPNRSWRHH